MKVFNDILEFLKSLEFVDIVFFCAVIALIILVITLIYFIKINKDVKEVKEETAEMKIVDEINKNLKASENRVMFTDFEQDQEDKAIISYEELLGKNKNGELNYEKEEMMDDLVVKKVNLDEIVNTRENTSYHSDARVISFDHEEAFLQALKRLNKELG